MGRAPPKGKHFADRVHPGFWQPLLILILILIFFVPFGLRLRLGLGAGNRHPKSEMRPCGPDLLHLADVGAE